MKKDWLRLVSYIVNCIAFPFVFFTVTNDWAMVALYGVFCIYNLFIIGEINVKKIDMEDIAKILESKKKHDIL